MKMLFASLLAIAFSPAATLLHAQSQETAALYAAARPYTDETLPQLKAHVHELSGIKPDINQTDLPGLLASVSEIVMAQMPRVPNLIAHEEIALEQPPHPPPPADTPVAPASVAAAAAAPNPSASPPSPPRRKAS